MADLGSMMGLYVGITLIFFIAKAILKGKDISEGKNSYSEIYMFIYLTSIVMFSYIINLKVTKEMCTSNQYDVASIVTFFPWIIILGMLTMLLQAFPGWKAPFSNTIGYGITKILGISSVLNNMLDLKNKSKWKMSEKLISKVYNRPSLLINMFTPENSQNALKMFNITQDEPNYKKFQKLVVIKDTVAECVWYIITGLLVISYQSSYLANHGCDVPLEEDELPDDDDMCAAPIPKPQVYNSS